MRLQRETSYFGGRSSILFEFPHGPWRSIHCLYGAFLTGISSAIVTAIPIFVKMSSSVYHRMTYAA